ncbi:MAG: 3-mercaptopyruvate sulfurtransferase [Granulosicoccus sp.]|nr:3-mercaptopyruvate sulfurtransferase [Granulosicoccus sp.]
MNDFQTLIDCKTLAAKITDNNVVVLDGTWFLPNSNRDAKAEFESGHIPGARFFDIDAISDQHSPLPHMVPSADAFSRSVESLGVSNDSQIVVYDAQGLFSAARVWWLFRIFGHQHVAVLDGGLPAWIAAGKEVTEVIADVLPGSYHADFNANTVVDLSGMQQRVKNQNALILDARSAARYKGEAPEPRPELQSGHMPGALSLPATDLMVEGRLKPVDELRALFKSLEVNEASPIVTTCGSGVTAAIITLALEHCGLGMHQLYDGSWTEWASAPGNPIEKNRNALTREER